MRCQSKVTGPSVNMDFWIEPSELINPDAQHCSGSEVTLLSNKSELKDDENHIFCCLPYNRSYNLTEPQTVKCWPAARSGSQPFHYGSNSIYNESQLLYKVCCLVWSDLSKVYLELSGTFTVFGLTRELQTALLQHHNPETDIVLDIA